VNEPPTLPRFDRVLDTPPASGRETLCARLTFADRQRARLRVRTEEGLEVALMIERGRILRDGTCVAGAGEQVLIVRAAPEPLSQVRAPGAVDLARAAYHLGNRHVAVQIGAGWLRYLQDHVLDDMLRGLGFTVETLEAGFEPEGGAYSGHSHGGASDPGHTHGGESRSEHTHAEHAHGEHDHSHHSHR
jgi:urease accessory protein